MSAVEPIRDKQDIQKVEDILSKNERNFLLFKFGINTGLRISDILKLDVKDVKNKDIIRIQEKKTKKIKQFQINVNLKTLIDKFTKNMILNAPLFRSVYSKRLERTYVYRMINEACDKAGIDIKAGTHTLRKTFGYHHYKQFRDVALLQRIFNHSSPNVTLRYIGIEQDEIDESYMNFYL